MPTKSCSSLGPSERWRITKQKRMLLVVEQQQVGLSGESEMVGKSGNFKPFVSLSVPVVVIQGVAVAESSGMPKAKLPEAIVEAWRDGGRDLNPQLAVAVSQVVTRQRNSWRKINNISQKYPRSNFFWHRVFDFGLAKQNTSSSPFETCRP